MTRHIYTRIHKYMCKYVLCTFLQKISRRYSLGVLTIVAVRQFLHTLFELLWYAGATRNVCIWVCVCLPHCAPSGRDAWFTFLCVQNVNVIDTPAFVWRNKCAYSRCVSVGCIYSCGPHCALPTRLQWTELWRRTAMRRRRRRFALVPFSSRLYHYFWLPTVATVCITRFVCLLFPSQARCILPHTHTHRLSSSFFPLSMQRRFELEIFVCSFSFVRLFSYSPFCCVPSSSTCFVVLHIRQAGGEWENELLSRSLSLLSLSLSELRQCVVYAGTRVWG